MTHEIVKPYVRFNPQTGKIDYLGRGDKVQPTSAELEKFPEIFKAVQKKGVEE